MIVEYFNCECFSPEHTLRFVLDEDNMVSVDSQFYPHMSIFKRLWLALRYVVNPNSINYPWGDTILKTEDLPRLIKLLKKGLKNDKN